MEASRFDAFTPKVVNWFFNILETFDWVKPENVVNVDKAGIMAGFSLDGLVLGSAEISKVTRAVAGPPFLRLSQPPEDP